MTPLAQKLYEANQQRYAAATKPLRSHGPDHHYRVYQHALALAAKLGVTYDEEVLSAATLLHDVAAYYPDQTGEQYHDFDHKIAAEVLVGIDFPKNKIDAVLYAIAHHGSHRKFQREDEAIEVTLLRDADKIDAFGPIGIARIIMARTLKGDSLPQIVDDFYTHKHLERKWHAITYDVAKEMAKPDYEYSRAFFGQLAQALLPVEVA